MGKNNVIRFLETKHIPFQTFQLPVEKLGAVETAKILSIPLELVHKTIVVTRERPTKPILAIVPGNRSVDLKALAEILNEKKLRLPTEHEAEELTGLQVGGISPLALVYKGFQTVLDSAATQYEWIHISGGQRGLNIRIRVEDLVTICNCRVENISLESD
jgi:Cys-tRNA(Pro)/Cys-tRNA(Cys) deacylase